MKNPNVEICSLIESRMNETTQEINKTDSIFQADKLHSELRILEWISSLRYRLDRQYNKKS